MGTERTRAWIGCPALTVTFINADCFGGVCEYAGLAVRNGEVLFRVEFDRAGIDNLRQLLKPLRVRLLTGYFQPFHRGYWKST
jgi:hypothetical protein